MSLFAGRYRFRVAANNRIGRALQLLAVVPRKLAPCGITFGPDPLHPVARRALWDITDDEIDSWSRNGKPRIGPQRSTSPREIPGVRDVLTHDDARWLDALAETIAPSEEPSE